MHSTHICCHIHIINHYLYSHLPTRELKLLLQGHGTLPALSCPVGAVLKGETARVEEHTTEKELAPCFTAALRETVSRQLPTIQESMKPKYP